MPAYDLVKIRGFLVIVDAPPTSAAKGKTFEDLACYLLDGVPGVQLVTRNKINTFATEEIDIACLTRSDPGGLSFQVDFFPVECKG